MLDKTFGEDMITVSMESLLFLRQLFEVSLRRLTSFRLEFATETKVATVNLFPSLASQEVTLGSHSRSVESQVYADHGLISRKRWFRDRDHDMEVEPALCEEKVCSTRGIALIPGSGGRNGKGDAHASLSGRQPHSLGLPVEDIGFLIIANRA